jgi:hypothetical protein
MTSKGYKLLFGVIKMFWRNETSQAVRVAQRHECRRTTCFEMGNFLVCNYITLEGSGMLDRTICENSSGHATQELKRPRGREDVLHVYREKDVLGPPWPEGI